MTVAREAAIEARGRTQHGALSFDQVDACGVPVTTRNNRLRDGRWLLGDRRVIILPGWPRTYEQRLSVACLAAGDEAYVSGEAGAAVRRLDAAKSLAPVEITALSSCTYRPRGATVHRRADVSDIDWTWCNNLKVATPANILVHLAARRTLHELERMYDSARRQDGLCYGELVDTVNRLTGKGRAGTVAARCLVGHLDYECAITASELEMRFLQLLDVAGIGRPECQGRVVRADGRLAYADFADRPIGLLFELKGYAWHNSQRALDRDLRRGNAMPLWVRKTLEFTWKHVLFDPAYVIDTTVFWTRQLAA